jgi:8-oxo-dGTP diphosphatase
MEHRPLVGVGVFVRQNGKILLGKRRGSHGEGTWALPGGHLEFGEELDECVRREIREETNLEVTGIRFGTITNDIFEDGERHYLTVYMVCDYAAGQLENLEPHKCEAWAWFGWDELPHPLFPPARTC